MKRLAVVLTLSLILGACASSPKPASVDEFGEFRKAPPAQSLSASVRCLSFAKWGFALQKRGRIQKEMIKELRKLAFKGLPAERLQASEERLQAWYEAEPERPEVEGCSGI